MAIECSRVAVNIKSCAPTMTSVNEVVSAPPPAQHREVTPNSNARITSLDAYRGFVMLLIMGEVLSLRRVAQALPESTFWKVLAWHQTHVEWIGCSLHDLIQPSFSFLVGVALPFSIASRMARRQSRMRMTIHAAWRALLLIMLGIFLRSTGQNLTYWTFTDTLSQIGLGYVFLFVLGFRPVRDQWIAFSAIIAGYWAAFACWPLPGANFNYAAVGVQPDWLAAYGVNGFAAHWQKNSNLAWAFDVWFLNVFPRERPFTFNAGGYSTLNFIPPLGTMILGLIAGRVLRREEPAMCKVKWLVIAGVAGLSVGWLVGWLGISPVVKAIWTPSWVLFSGGWCFLLLAAFYYVIDIWQKRRWATCLVVIGVNSIAAYVMAHLWKEFILKSLTTHIGSSIWRSLGAPYEPLLLGGATLVIMWLILKWMNQRSIYIKI